MSLGKKATIRQVASKAGVSIQTVSRVLNNHPYVADTTRQRVQDAIQELSYRPDAIARSLINRRSSTLGVVITEVGHYGPHRMLVGIEHQAAELGYALALTIIHDHEPGYGSRQLEQLLSRQVEGIIWAVPEIGDNQIQAEAFLRSINLSVPVTFLTGGVAQNLPTVLSDNRRGGIMATEHLLAQGRRRIGLIGGPSAWTVARERQLGWNDALSAAGLPPERRQWVEGDWSPASGEQGFHQLIEQFPEMDAIFVGNDQMALGALQAAHALGRRVPEDLAVVGFDATAESAYYFPPLTSIRQHLRTAGSTAVRELHRVIECEQHGQSYNPASCIVIAPELIVRRSSVL